MALGRESGKELLDFPLCCGLSETGACNWLSLSRCQGDGCPFQKSLESRESSKIKRRLCSLSEERQARIAAKYYAGKRPWQEE